MNIGKHSKLIQTDLRYIIKGSSSTMLGQIGISAIAFLSAIAFANLLPKNIYGNYQYILAVAEFVTIVSLTGLTTSVIRSVAKGFEGTLDYSFRENLKWSIGAVIIGIGVGMYYLVQGNLILGYGILIASLCTPLINSSKLFSSHLIGKKLFTKSSSYSVIGNAVPTVTLIGALFLTQNVIILIGVYFLMHSATNFALFLLARKTIENNDRETATLSFAKHLSLQNVITKAAGHLDKVLLFQFAGAIALAEYIFAISVPRQIQHLFKSAKMIILPKVSARSYSELRESLPKKVAILYIFIVPITLGYIFLAPLFFKIAFPQYEASVIYSQLYALLLLLAPINVLNDVFIGHAKKAILYKISIATALLKLVTTISLVPFYGIWGVVFSVLVTQSSHALLTIYYFFKTKE